MMKKKPTEYMKQLDYETLIFTLEALRHLAAEVGSSQIMIGIDYSHPWEDKTVNHVMSTPSLTDDERIATPGGTPARLLNIE